jgi:hypothetical protein
MTAARKVVLMLVILAAVLVTVPSAVAGFDVPNGDWDYTKNGSSAEEVEEIYIENKDDTVLFGADIKDNSGLNGGTLQVYIDTDQGETGKESSSSSSEYYDGLDPISADYRVSVSDGGFPIIQEYNDEDELYEFIQGVEYEEKSGIAVVEVEKETIENPEAFDVKFVHIYDDVSDGKYDWLPNSDIKSYQVTNEDIGINERKSATIDVKPTFSESLNNASVEVILTADSGEIVETKTREDVNTNALTVPFTVDPENFNDDGGFVEVVVEDDERFAVDDEIDNTASINTDITDGNGSTVDSRVDFSYIESGVQIRDEDELDSVAFTLSDDNPDNEDRNRDANTDATNRSEGSATKSTREIFTVNSNNYDEGDGTLSVEVEGNRPFPEQSSDIKSIEDAPKKVFDLSDVEQELIVDSSTETVDIASADPSFDVDVSARANSSVESITHVIEFDERLDENEVSVDFADRFDNELKYNTNSTVNEGEIEIEMYSLGSDAIIPGDGDEDSIADITFNFDDPNSVKQNLDQGSENAEPLTVNTLTSQSELRTDIGDSGDALSYSTTDPGLEIKNSQTRLTDAEVTHLTKGGNMVGAPLKIDVEVETNDGELQKIELFNFSGSKQDTIECGNESTCGEDEILRYTPSSPSVAGDGSYGATGHRIEVTTNGSTSYNLSEEFETIEEKDIGAEVYVKGDVNMDGPSNSKIVRLGDVNTVIENRGEEADGLPWDTDELARADLNNDGQIDINDITTVISQYTPAEGNVEFSNDQLDVSDDTVDINVSGLNNVVNESVDVVIVNNDNDETKDITTRDDADLKNGSNQNVGIDTTNVEAGDELEVQIHEVSDPDPEDAGGSPIDTATKEVEINVNRATVKDGSANEIEVSFDSDVVVNGTVSNASSAFTFDPDDPLTNEPVSVETTDLTEKNGNIIVPLNSSINSSDPNTLTNALDYDDTDEDVVADSDGTPAEGFSDESVTNDVS